MADGAAAVRKRRKMPAQKPGSSKQDYGTPWEFIDAVEDRFGKLAWDLAASADNCVVRNVLGDRSASFFSERENSLAQEWRHLGDLLWLNPPFDQIAKFAEKCATEADPRARILFLVPASVCSNWFWKWVRPHAIVYCIDRIQFVGTEHVYPKDLVLAGFGFGATGLGRWRWRGKESKR